MSRTGGCACGAVRFEATGDFLGTGTCHCTDCQAASGGGPNVFALVARDDFKVTSGAPALYEKKADSGNRIQRAYCPDCGTPLWSVMAYPALPIRFGAFDDNSDFSPQMQIYTASAPKWHPMRDDIPSFEGMPPM
ncbi:GFA family protein [Palleronia caenipelagi]|uniref:GFA family protein n=1 Tax=Palleronia caenipelagi TaxID=2489174 RepID=A0A547PNR4_9RHOB|nr:GFA family protein [Palleronia caenipelagi]TRD15674.1 GFA family protein [Palleronia caenipelagi]